MNKIYQKCIFKMKNASKSILGALTDIIRRMRLWAVSFSEGFTLIELLVVVLIIGILAAVALPQYAVAVEKSRAVQAITFLKTWKDSEEIYYMDNGSYTWSLENLGLSAPDALLKDFEFDRGGEQLVGRFSLHNREHGYYLIYSGTYRQASDIVPLELQSGKLYCYSGEADDLGKRLCRSLGSHKADDDFYAL